MSERPLYFLHIPKTAGMSVSAWLLAQRGVRLCPDNLWSQLLRRDRASLGEFDSFAGHFYTGLARYLGRDVNAFTFLRHPVERSRSHYLHIMRDQGHYLHERARQLGTFTAFMQDPLCLPMLYNFQTRSLSMELDIQALQENLTNPDNGPFPLERQIESSLDGYSSAINLPCAMAFLDRCCFVGITEQMADSLSELERVLNTGGSAGSPPMLNASANKSELGTLTRIEYRQLIALLADDLALYEYAKLVYAPKPQ